MSELRLLSEKQKVPVDLDTYIKKLANSRKRIMLVNDILQNVQVRCQTWQGRSHQYGWSGFNWTTFKATITFLPIFMNSAVHLTDQLAAT